MLRNLHKIFFVLSIILASWSSSISAAGLEERVITIRGNERFELVDNKHLQFKFQPLSKEAKALEITKDASSLGVSYLGQLQLKGNFTALSALRSIGDQIADSLSISFGVVADSNSSQALKENELLLLYHPQVIITLSLVRVNEQSPYEIICTYTLKDIVAANAKSEPTNSAQATEEITTEIVEENNQQPAIIESE